MGAPLQRTFAHQLPRRYTSGIAAVVGSGVPHKRSHLTRIDKRQMEERTEGKR
ncbi:hypothetical protein Acin_0557 [Acidaminococcus intestini RyC-MR95]|uniref:Uncharacterized protein n=1 Tax=Acidaminococcus intestini (strain RyC-MR95) TaxID=568816 RepID=G4Q3S4_ACIIR|nr:hypothetical protein Acin_0557 [Acidaminococcus intestini RyC-MR95]